MILPMGAAVLGSSTFPWRTVCSVFSPTRFTATMRLSFTLRLISLPLLAMDQPVASFAHQLSLISMRAARKTCLLPGNIQSSGAEVGAQGLPQAGVFHAQPIQNNTGQVGAVDQGAELGQGGVVGKIQFMAETPTLIAVVELALFPPLQARSPAQRPG